MDYLLRFAVSFFRNPAIFLLGIFSVGSARISSQVISGMDLLLRDWGPFLIAIRYTAHGGAMKGHFFSTSCLGMPVKSSGCSFLNFSTEAFNKGSAFFARFSSCSAVNGLGLSGRLLSSKADFGLYGFLAGIMDTIHIKECYPKIVNNKGIFIRKTHFVSGNLLVYGIDSKPIAGLILAFSEFLIKIDRPTLFRASHHIDKVRGCKDQLSRVKPYNRFDILLRERISFGVIMDNYGILHFKKIFGTRSNTVGLPNKSSDLFTPSEYVQMLPVGQPDFPGGLLWCFSIVWWQGIVVFAFHVFKWPKMKNQPEGVRLGKSRLVRLSFEIMIKTFFQFHYWFAKTNICLIV